ncbi:hypothetical protein RDI58_004622 [Solanum bulbocastanum]|uniref:NAP1-related protein 2 n=1 Tax=Solanum bulbocastanum TaxID=147425 RepID=A0AAN8U4W6_SOLBU
MVIDNSKKLKTADEEQIGTGGVFSIEKLQEVQDELEKVNEQASEEVLEIEQKYNEIRRPVYEKRNELIKSIPDFWVTAFLSHPALGELLNVEDQKIFKYLDSLDVEDFKDVTSGYSLTFVSSLFLKTLLRTGTLEDCTKYASTAYIISQCLQQVAADFLLFFNLQIFKPNPYFEDTKLVKTYTFLDEGSTKITGTAIKWKEGMGAAYGGNPEMKGNKRPASEDSFFSWFSETQLKDIADGLSDEVGEIIKEDLWPNPLKYFNNEADEEDSDGDEDTYQDDEDEEDNNDDDDEEDEDDG